MYRLQVLGVKRWRTNWKMALEMATAFRYELSRDDSQDYGPVFLCIIVV